MLVPDLVFLHFAAFPRCSARVDKHFPDYCTLQLMSSGGITLSYDDVQYPLRGRWWWPCYPGPHIRFHPDPPGGHWFHRYVAFRGRLMDRWREAGLLTFLPQRAAARHVTTYDALLRLVGRTDRLGRLRAINGLETILLDLADRRGQATSPWVEAVHEALERQSTLWPDYDALALDLHMGRSTLRRQYRQAAGRSLHDYLLHRRVAAACELLSRTDMPLKTVADELGYRDVYFFSRQFRALVGLPPAAYRRSRI